MALWRVLVYIHVARLRLANTSTRHNRLNKQKRANKMTELPKIKRQNTKASEVGFRAEPLAKTPTFSLTPYS